MGLSSLLQLRLLPYWSLAQISELGPCVWSLCSCSQLSFSLCHMGLSPLMRGLLLSLLPGFQAASFQAEKGGNHTSLRASLLSDTTTPPHSVGQNKLQSQTEAGQTSSLAAGLGRWHHKEEAGMEDTMWAAVEIQPVTLCFIYSFLCAKHRVQQIFI